MRLILLTFLLSIIFLPAHAQESSSETLCRLLPEHKPKPTDGVQYLVGIDVHGNPVVAADLNPPLPVMDQAVIIPIEVDLVERFTLDVPDGVELKPSVAVMKIHKDGRVEYNGQDVSNEAYYLCGKGELPEPEAPQGSGHKPDDAVPSGGVIEGQYP